MIGKTIALLIVTSLLVPAALADPATHDSGTCGLNEWVDGMHYTGSGDLKLVLTSGGNLNAECQGQLYPDSAIPEKAIVIKIDGGNKIITPGGHFSWIEKFGKNV